MQRRVSAHLLAAQLCLPGVCLLTVAAACWRGQPLAYSFAATGWAGVCVSWVWLTRGACFVIRCIVVLSCLADYQALPNIAVARSVIRSLLWSQCISECSVLFSVSWGAWRQLLSYFMFFYVFATAPACGHFSCYSGWFPHVLRNYCLTLYLLLCSGVLRVQNWLAALFSACSSSATLGLVRAWVLFFILRLFFLFLRFGKCRYLFFVLFCSCYCVVFFRFHFVWQ